MRAWHFYLAVTTFFHQPAIHGWCSGERTRVREAKTGVVVSATRVRDCETRVQLTLTRVRAAETRVAQRKHESKVRGLVFAIIKTPV